MERSLIDEIRAHADDLDEKIFKMIGQGYQLTEIAQMLGVHRNTINYRIERMRKWLKRSKN